MDVKQLYGRNDMVMLEQHNKIYGSLGIVEQTILKTEEGNPVILKNPKPGVAESVITDFKMQGWTEQVQYEGNQLFDGVFTVDTVLDTNGETVPYSGRSTTDFIKVKQSTDYTGFARYLRACYYDAGKVFISHDDDDDTVTRQTPEGCEYVRFCFINGSNVMFNEGSTALPYEPYTGGKPSPSPDYPQKIVSAGKYNEDTQKYEYQVKLTGKNMLPRYDSPSDWMPGGYFYIPIHGFIVGETYTASQQNTPEAGEDFYVSIGTYAGNANAGVQHWLYHKNGGNLTKKSVSFKATQEVYYLNVSNISGNGVAIDSAKLDKFLELFPDLMLEIGSEPTEYTPYQEQTVTLTADRQLTKWDKLEKRDGVWGWVYKSAEIVLDGSEDEDWKRQIDANRKIQFYITLSDALYHYSDPFKKMFYCNTFFTTNAGGAIPKWQVRKGSYNGLAPVFKPSDDIDTVELFRNFLAENQTNILYVTKEETFIPLSESEQEQMNELEMYLPTTVITNDVDCDMIVTYKATQNGGEWG